MKAKKQPGFLVSQTINLILQPGRNLPLQVNQIKIFALLCRISCSVERTVARLFSSCHFIYK
jgi:hypothetical protein